MPGHKSRSHKSRGSSSRRHPEEAGDSSRGTTDRPSEPVIPSQLQQPMVRDPIHGRYSRLVTGMGFGTKAIYDCLENTEGALEDEPDVPDIVDSGSYRVMDQMMAAAIDGPPIDGWTAEHWRNYMLSGQPRIDSWDNFTDTWRPHHLCYSFSRDRRTYVVKSASVRNNAVHIIYPFALSNLIGLTCLRHNVSGEGLRHLIFHDICNQNVLSAIDGAFRAAGMDPPRRRGYSSGGSSSSLRSSATPRGGNEYHHVQLIIKAPEQDPTHQDAWNQLHTGNLFTKAINHLRCDDTRICESLGPVTHCSILVVAAAHYTECTLIYHFGEPGRPTTTHAGKGKGIARG